MSNRRHRVLAERIYVRGLWTILGVVETWRCRMWRQAGAIVRLPKFAVLLLAAAQFSVFLSLPRLYLSKPTTNL